MNETQRRIKAYQAALPALRERVVAVALLLAMSAAMMTSASFAWLTISRSPAVTGVNTTVAANGNLEIALVATNGSAPGESAVGDSSAADGQTVSNSNLTWGNLVNLSDSRYGLENLTLRPAQLNQSALLTSPLFGAVYLEDGRIERLSSSFAYATWQPDSERFLVNNDYGVRAISSTTVEAVGFAQQVYEKRSDAESANLAAGSSYIAITQNKEWMDSLATVMGTFMTAKMNAGQGDESLTNPTIEKEDVQNLRDIFAAFVEVYEEQFVAMAKLVNYQLFLLNNSESGSIAYTEYTADTIKNATEASLKQQGLQATGLDLLKSDYNKLCTNLVKLDALCLEATVTWSESGLNEVVSNLMNVGTCTLDGTPINNIGVSNATGYLDGEVHNAVITNGILYNFEKLNGTRCKVEGLNVSAKVKRMGMTIPASISANITTNAPVPSQFSTSLEYADSLNQGGQGVEVAQDTYGLAIDLWVRTNADNSYLTLEGNVLTKTETVNATSTDANGNVVNLYTLTRKETVETEATDGTVTTEEITFDLDLYKVETTDDEGNVTTAWYNAVNHATVTLAEGETPIAKMVDVVTVIGFEGENRVWEDSTMLDTDSTTQGSGSCYVYYADTPEDQARSLDLLAAMNVVFVDDQGKLLATAVMDTEQFYAENGRVTVPLVLQSDSMVIGTDSTGKSIYGITALEKNVPKRITAIVYLDGTKLTNKDVLAASDIQGRLNIQFGSSVNLSHAEDEALMNAIRSVSASVSQTSFSYEQCKESGTPMTTTVTLNITGDEPKTVTAFFIRSISSTQGSREEVMTFEKQADGTWTSDYTFTAPGNYILRSVELDGMSHDLKDCPTVEVEGFTIQSLSCDQSENNHISIMTAESSSSVNLQLQFASSDVDAMPTTVQGRFLRDDGTAVNINFTYNSKTAKWEGKATFLSSGDYTLQYLVLDGEYTQMSSTMWQTATVYLGMKAAIYTDSPQAFLYQPDELANNELNLYMKVRIMDDTGEDMLGLTNVTLYYASQTSSLAEKGLITPLQWNAASGYYEGAFESKVGSFNFNYITVGNNTITHATTSPTFRISSPNPPAYTGYVNNPYLFVPNADGTFKLYMTDSATATVQAVIRNLDTQTTYAVQGELAQNDYNSDDLWQFLIPVTNGSQDGNWQLETIHVWNYYQSDGTYVEAMLDADGNLVPEDAEYQRDEPLTFDLTGDNIVTKAVTTVTITVSGPDDAELGKDGDTITGAFMDTHELTGLAVSFVDYQGQPIGTTAADGTFTSYVSKVVLNYTYGLNASSYGGYTSETLTNAVADFSVTLQQQGSTTNFSADAVTVQYAGTYTPELTYEINGTHYTMAAADMGDSAPAFSVWSKAPTVTVTGITPTVTSTNRHYNTTTPTSVEQLVTGSFFSKDDFNAVVYLYFKYATDYGSYDQEAFDVLIPKVQLTLSGMPDDFTSATATFDSVEYKFTPGELQLSKEIGSATDGEYSYTIFADHTYPIMYPAGTHYIDNITVVYNSVEYTLNLTDRVTISQPDAPVYLDYTVYGYGFSGNEPDMEISHDGGAITVTLPTVDNWVSRQTEYSYGDATPVVTTSTVSYLTSSKKGFVVTTYYYDLYTRTKTSITASTTTTVFDGTYAITGWKIGDTVYAPGDKVTISVGQTAIAVIEEVKSERVVVSTNTATQTTVTLQDVFAEATSQYFERSDATTTLYTEDKYPNGYTYVE